MSRIIELMGLPSAGKSTLAHLLLKEMRECGGIWWPNDPAVIRCLRRREDGILRNLLKRFPYPVWEPISGSRHALAELHAFSSAHPALFELMFELVSRESVPPLVRQCVLYTLYLHCAERQLLDVHLRPGEGVIVEEGLAMGLLSLLDCLPPDAPCDGEVSRFVRHMPAPFGLVWIDADPAECVARLRRRPVLPLPWAECSDRELLELLVRRRHGLGLAFAECERRGIPCCRIPNSERDASSAPALLREQGRAWARRTEAR